MHALFNTAAFPGKYIQGEGAMAELPRLVRNFGINGFLIGSSSAIHKVLPASGIQDLGSWITTEVFGGECSEVEIERILALVLDTGVDIVVGMGGGKAIDTAKIVSDRAGVPVIIVPTIASTDAPCSGCAVIYTVEGVFDRVHYQSMNPQVVLVDTRVIANAPGRFLVAGMGDALATWFEARSCHQSRSENACGGNSTMAGLNLARLCYDTLLAYGVAARLACENKIVTPALERVVEANILLSGIGFESGGLATAHAVHNGLSVLEETHAYYHGEKVAFGVLTGLHLTGASTEEMDTVYTFCEEIGLPTSLSDIGIMETDRNKLMRVAEKACIPEECIHHEPEPVNPQKVLDAMIAADAMGKSRKR